MAKSKRERRASKQRNIEARKTKKASRVNRELTPKTIPIVKTNPSTADLINLSPEKVNKMSKADLKKVVTQISKTANKRIARSESAGKATREKFASTKEQSINDLRNQFKEVSKYLKTTNKKPAVKTKKISKTSELLQSLTPEKVNKMTKEELQEVVSKLSVTANRRINTLIKSGKVSETKYQKFSAKDKSRNELLHELKRVSKFLGDEGTTLKGIAKRKVKLDLQFERVTGRKIDELSKEQQANYWEALNKYRELYPLKGSYKYDVTIVAEMAIDGVSSDDMVKAMEEMGSNYYEFSMAKELGILTEEQQQYGQFGGKWSRIK